MPEISTEHVRIGCDQMGTAYLGLEGPDLLLDRQVDLATAVEIFQILMR